MFYIVCLDLWNVKWTKKIPIIVPEISSNMKTTVTWLLHHANSEAGKSSWVSGTRANGRVSINTFICALESILLPASTPIKNAYRHRNCFRKYKIRSFHDDRVQQNFRCPTAASCGWMASEPAFREPPCLFSSSSLMTRADLVLKTLVRSPPSLSTRLLAT
jgi:hypothetical protein